MAYGHFTDNIFNCIFFKKIKKENIILIRISLKLVPESLIDNKSALVYEMAWRLTGGKPFPEPMMTKSCNAIWHE